MAGTLSSPTLIEPNLTRAEELVMRLMSLPGKSCEEAVIAEFICDHLSAAGLPGEAITIDKAHAKTPQPGNVGNVIVKIPGTKRGPRRMLSAHMDTVPLCVGSQPRREGDFVRSALSHTALGADDRAGVAVVLNTALEIIERKLPTPPLTFCFFVQEEIGLQGARVVQPAALGKPAMCFNFDGGNANKITYGATGGYKLEIDVRGIASHAGIAPEKGVSAITIASLALADLHRGGWLGLVQKGKHRGTSNVGVIQGGSATNVVADHVVLRAEARSHSRPFRERIVKEIEKAFKAAVKETRSSLKKLGQVTFNGRLDYEAFRLEEDHSAILEAQRAIQEIEREPEMAISNGGLDANWLHVHGIPSVSLGAGQMSPHTVDEALNVPQFEDSCRIALRLAMGS